MENFLLAKEFSERNILSGSIAPCLKKRWKERDLSSFIGSVTIGMCAAGNDEENTMKNIVNQLYEYLEQFMIGSNWQDEHVPEQARSMFTTICFVGNIDADMAKADRMLNDLYFRAAMEEMMEFDAFENFMYEYIV